MTHSSIAIQVLPQSRDTSARELCRIVDAVIAYIAGTGLHYVVGPFETVIEGDLDRLMEIIRRCTEICIEEGAQKVSSYIKLVHAPAEEILSIDEKIKKYQK
jgi:uncharacterized protein YqgV (UPF0045/DUF77 family)